MTLAAVLAACSGGPAVRPEARATAAPPPAVTARLPAVADAPDFGPAILLPDPEQPDAEVARVGDLVLRESHGFRSMLAADPKIALSAIDLMVFDALVARHAVEFGIAVDPAAVRAHATKEETELEQQVRNELGPKVTLAEYVWRMQGLRMDEWRRINEQRVARRTYHGLVIRYLALREDRAQVRCIAHRDKALLERIAEQVREGADFATLAARHAEEGMRDGGLLPTFDREFPHPAARVAFDLEPGQLTLTSAGEGADQRHYLVFCLQRIPARPLPYAAVRAEVEADLAARPLTAVETNAYTLRWRAASERKP